MVAVFCKSELKYPTGSGGELFPVEILNGRETNPGSWEECGFELRERPSQLSNWQDDDEIARVHYPEMASFARELTGCDVALIGSHIKRNPEQAELHSDLAPIQLVHSDFAESYGDLIRRHYATEAGTTELRLEAAGITPEDVANARRLVIVQFWRNLGPEKMDLPIAFCDARSVDTDDVVAFPVKDYAGGGFDFEALGILGQHVDQHRWYAFPNLSQDEVVVFRTYDSDRVGTEQPFWTPHAAFRDPEVPLGQPSRSSMEMRATCLFF